MIVILCRIGFFFLIFLLINFFYEKLESCFIVFCCSMDCVFGVYRFLYLLFRFFINFLKINFFIFGFCISVVVIFLLDFLVMVFIKDFLFFFIEYGVILFILYIIIWYEKF